MESANARNPPAREAEQILQREESLVPVQEGGRKLHAMRYGFGREIGLSSLVIAKEAILGLSQTVESGFMKTFYGVTVVCFLLALLLVCFYAPWVVNTVGSANTSIGYAPVWSTRYAGVAGAQVDRGALGFLAGAAAFFSIVIGGSAYFFRNKRTGEKDLME